MTQLDNMTEYLQPNDVAKLLAVSPKKVQSLDSDWGVAGRQSQRRTPAAMDHSA